MTAVDKGVVRQSCQGLVERSVHLSASACETRFLRQNTTSDVGFVWLTFEEATTASDKESVASEDATLAQPLV